MDNYRLKMFREQLNQNGIDGALVFSDVNRNYLTGFTGDDSYIVVTAKESIFITDSRYTEQARNEVSGFEVRQFSGGVFDYIKDLVKTLDIKNLGFEENFMTYSTYKELSDNLQGVSFVKLEGIIGKQREIKDKIEIANIERAASIADDGFSHILKFIKPGMTELSIGMELEFFMRSKGASGLSFPSIVASGKRSSLPHGTATGKIVEKGDFLTLDFGCVYNGYCSDITRTIVIGNASEKQKELYKIVLEANKEALKHVEPGITGEKLDLVARGIIEKNGFGEYFGHGLGHGVGMEVHERPYISKRGKDPLAAGMVLTDEPGIYIPGFGGVRVEDLVLVTDNGCSVLSKSNKELIEL